MNRLDELELKGNQLAERIDQTPRWHDDDDDRNIVDTSDGQRISITRTTPSKYQRTSITRTTSSNDNDNNWTTSMVDIKPHGRALLEEIKLYKPEHELLSQVNFKKGDSAPSKCDSLRTK